MVKTGDGSHTIYNTALNEHYHSVHGAVNESTHVFINAGLKEIVTHKKNISILEVGLGTGLNLLLTLSFFQSNREGLQIGYTALEPFPPGEEFINALNYTRFFDAAFFQQIHECDFNTQETLLAGFIFEKVNQKLQGIDFIKTFDLIYYDAFAPLVQPEMWNEDVFKKLFDCLNQDGILVTYCAKGEVKRTLKKVGFKVESLPGPPGKREMIRARKII